MPHTLINNYYRQTRAKKRIFDELHQINIKKKGSNAESRIQDTPDENISVPDSLIDPCCNRVFDGAACECERDTVDILPIASLGNNLHVFG